MKNIICSFLIFIGTIISSMDLSHMFQGHDYSFGSILGGLTLAFLGWFFLADFTEGIGRSAAKTAGCVAVLLVILTVTGGSSDTSSSGKTIRNPDSPVYPTKAPYTCPDCRRTGYCICDDDDEPTICWTCYGKGVCKNCDGTGKYDYGTLIGNRCRVCEGNGKCPGCDGHGVYR